MFPYHAQETGYTCGAASLRMILEYFGISKSEKQISKILNTNRVRGTWPRYVPSLAEKYMFDYVVLRKASIGDIKRLMHEGYLVVIIYCNDKGGDHYSVVKRVGKRFISFWEPDPDFGPETRLTLKKFDRIWETDPNFSRHMRRWLCGIRKP